MGCVCGESMPESAAKPSKGCDVNSFFRGLTAVFAAGVASLAFAQADVGLVSRVSGEVSYASATGSVGKAAAFMRVREGDRYAVERGAQVRVVYMRGGRQESWTGPAAFRVGEARCRNTPGCRPSGFPAS